MNSEMRDSGCEMRDRIRQLEDVLKKVRASLIEQDETAQIGDYDPTEDLAIIDGVLPRETNPPLP